MIDRSFVHTVRASDFFDESVIMRQTLVALTQHIFDFRSYWNRFKISIDCQAQGSAPVYVLFGGDVAVTVNTGYFIFTNDNQEFEISARYVRVISTGTPDVSNASLY